MDLKKHINTKDNLTFGKYLKNAARYEDGFDAAGFITIVLLVVIFVAGLFWGVTGGPLGRSDNFVINPKSFDATYVYNIHRELKYDDFDDSVNFDLRKNQIFEYFSKSETRTPMFTMDLGKMDKTRYLKFKIKDENTNYEIQETVVLRPSFKKYLTEENGSYKAHFSLNDESDLFDSHWNKKVAADDTITISLINE